MNEEQFKTLNTNLIKLVAALEIQNKLFIEHHDIMIDKSDTQTTMMIKIGASLNEVLKIIEKNTRP